MPTPLFDRGMSNAELVPFLTCHILVAISNIILNSSLLAAIKKLKKGGSTSYMFIKVLCTSDITVGIFQFVYIFLRCGISQYDSETLVRMELVVQTIFYFGAPFSGGMILIISADRYIHMKYLTKYNQIMTYSRAWILIAANLVLQLSTSISLMFASMRSYFEVLQPAIVCGYILMISTSIILYCGAYKSIKTRTRNSCVSVEAIPGSPSTTTERRARSLEFSRAMMYILMSLGACYMPFLVLTSTRSLMLWLGKPVPHRMMYALLWTYNINFSLSTLNVIIFIALNREFKAHAKKIIGKGRVRRRSSFWTEMEEFSHAQLPRKISHRLTVVSSPW